MGKKKLNKIVILENYSIIYTSKNQEILVDTEDLTLLAKYTWYVDAAGYARSTEILADKKIKCFNMHRFLLKPPLNLLVDHINHNKIDNRKSNLRIVTASQNQMNQLVAKHNRTGVRGVSFKRKKWHACIIVNGEFKHLGVFSEFEEAVEVRKKAEKLYFGDYNFKGYADDSLFS